MTRSIVNGSHRLPLTLCWMAIIAASLIATGSARAGAFGSTTAPSKPTKSGLSLRMEVDWAQGPGYLPVKVTINDASPAAGDRTFTVELKGVFYLPNDPKSIARQDIEMPGGAASATAMISLPTAGNVPHILCNVWEDGVKVEELETGPMPTNTGPMWGWGGAVRDTAAMFVVNRDPADILPIVEGFGQRGYWTAQQSSNATFPIHGAQGIEFVPPANLSSQWIDYVALDLLCLSLRDLGELQASSPDKLAAIRRWVWAGGNLWVFGAGDESQLSSLEALLLPHLESGRTTAERWRSPAGAERTTIDSTVLTQLQGEAVFGGGMYVPLPAVDVDDDGNPVQSTEPVAQAPKPSAREFRIRNVELGQIVAIAESDPDEIFKFSALDWRTIRVACGNHRVDWSARHGISTVQANQDFWNFLIAGVGLPPVTVFRVLITVFTVLIGPINYWWLRKKRRLHLLLFVVPASAAVVTISLGVYAIFADGFATQLRSRSYTRIDQASGESQAWTRLSYYAGLAPSQGLSFSTQTAVLPIQYSAGGRTFDNSRTTGWSDRQHLASGWLNSRTPTQYLTIRSAPSRRRIKVDAAGDNGRPRVTNELGVSIRHLLLCDGAGAPYYVGELASDATATLTPAAECKNQLDVAIRDVQLSLPTAPAAMQYNSPMTNSWRRQRRQFYMYGFMGQSAAPTQTASRLEQSIAGATEAFRQSIVEERNSSDGVSIAVTGTELEVREPTPTLGPRRYWAIVARPPDAEFGVPDVVEDAAGSFHLVEGVW